MGRKTLSIDESVYADLESVKPDDATWNRFLQRLVTAHRDDARDGADRDESAVVSLTEDQHRQLVRDVVVEVDTRVETALADAVEDLRGY